MPGGTVCCVFGCEGKTSPKHRFPNPNKDFARYKKWVELCGNEKLRSKDPSMVYRSNRVCHKHFEKKYYGSNKLLIKTSLPTLNLPRPLTVIDENFPPEGILPIYLIHKEHSYHKVFGNITNICVQDRPQAEEIYQRDFEQAGPSHAEMVTDAGPSQVEIVTIVEPPTKRNIADNISISTPKRRNTSLLQLANVTRIDKLCPKAKIFYKKALQYKRLAHSRLGTKYSVQKKFKLLENFTESKIYEKLKNPYVADFFISQIRQGNKKAKGRRFSLKDKLLAITLYRQSGPSGYRVLRELFALPSRKTLMSVLNRIKVNPGINETIFRNLRLVGQNMSKMNKMCILSFDEISLSANVYYNKHEDCFEGFEDFGDKSTSNISDHACVFFVRGMFKAWKQPVYYHFVKSATHTIDLVRTIKSVVKEVTKAGFSIVATVCDQGANNSAAINYLVKETKERYAMNQKEYRHRIIDIDGHEIVPLFDPPHLIKGIRNNWLNKDLFWEKEGKLLHGKWAHLYNAYYIDANTGDLKQMPKITDYHVDIKKIKKMKVSYCTQALSYKMATTIQCMARNNESSLDGKVTMPTEAKNTGTIVHFFDQLFDSVNAGASMKSCGKILKSRVTKTSAHLQFWKDAIFHLRNMYYLDRNGKKCRPPTLINWVRTLQGLIYLHQKLFLKQGIKFFSCRKLNQDLLENFFCQMRQHGGRNCNPTPTNFRNYYKSLLVKTFVSGHSLGANCENFDNDQMLFQLEAFLMQGVEENEMVELKPINFVIPLNSNSRSVDLSTIGYISGYIAKVVLRSVQWNICKTHIIGLKRNMKAHEITCEREFNQTERLKYCTGTFIDCIKMCYTIIRYFLNKLDEMGTVNIYRYIFRYIKEHINFPFVCHIQEIENLIISKCIYLVIFQWTKGLNRVLTGKENSKQISFYNPIYRKAQDIYTNKLKRKNLNVNSGR